MARQHQKVIPSQKIASDTPSIQTYSWIRRLKTEMTFFKSVVKLGTYYLCHCCMIVMPNGVDDEATTLVKGPHKLPLQAMSSTTFRILDQGFPEGKFLDSAEQ